MKSKKRKIIYIIIGLVYSIDTFTKAFAERKKLRIGEL